MSVHAKSTSVYRQRRSRRIMRLVDDAVGSMVQAISLTEGHLVSDLVCALLSD